MHRAVARRLAPLALLAMLLLALLPTLGRVAGRGIACESGVTSSMAVAPDGAATAMPDMTPIQHRAHLAATAASRGAPTSAPPPSRKRPGAPGHGGHDCPYCPLLAGLASTVPPTWSPHAPLAHAPWSVRALGQYRGAAPVPALGSQGPPRRRAA